VYAGCTFHVAFNQPFEESNYLLGIAIQFFVFGSADNCTTVICQNNPNIFGDEFDCSFTYDPIAHGNAIYIYSQALDSDDLKTITWNVGVTCNNSAFEKNTPKISKARKTVDVFPALLGTCDTTAALIPERFPIAINGSVKSNNNFTDNDHYYFQVCGDGIAIKNLTTVVQGTDLNGAFTTYMCPSLFATGSFCYPVNSPTGFNNAFPTAYSRIENAMLTNPQDTVYLTVRGAGNFNANSAYLWSVVSK